ncbi:hypothetical protein [Streptomyces sp. NPDC048425]|uniref:hypothetical protein n=1 Tax=Streptomyces sp. NPDC048425 TaxID=3365548 RepID=UPI00371836FC
MNLIAHPRTIAALGPALDEVIAELRYGTVALNAGTGVGHLTATATWGAFPGHTLDDVQSGIGVVHNALLLDGPERTVVRGPFRPAPRSLLHGEMSLYPNPRGSSPTAPRPPRAGSSAASRRPPLDRASGDLRLGPARLTAPHSPHGHGASTDRVWRRDLSRRFGPWKTEPDQGRDGPPPQRLLRSAARSGNTARNIFGKEIAG